MRGYSLLECLSTFDTVSGSRVCIAHARALAAQAPQDRHLWCICGNIRDRARLRGILDQGNARYTYIVVDTYALSQMTTM